MTTQGEDLTNARNAARIHRNSSGVLPESAAFVEAQQRAHEDAEVLRAFPLDPSDEPAFTFRAGAPFTRRLGNR